MTKLLGVAAAAAAALVLTGCGPTSAAPPTGGDVAILVLDKFSAAGGAIPGASPGPLQGPSSDAKSTPGPTRNCAASGLPTNEVGSGGGGLGLPAGVSHGKAVYDTIASELERTGRTLVHQPPITVDGQPVDVWTYQGHRILLVAVDTADYDTATITANLHNEIRSLDAHQSISRFVLNMSFSLVPCDLASWYQQNGDPNLDTEAMLQAYRSAIDGVPEVADLKHTLDQLTGAHPTVGDLMSDPNLVDVLDFVLINLYEDQFVDVAPENLGKSVVFQQQQLDPLYGLLADLTTQPGYRVIPVGAAGNGVVLPSGAHRQLPFPTAPAVWDSVVSTSSAGTEQRLLDYSNSGEVMMQAQNPYDGSGTSFAAPHLSAIEALYLLHGGPVQCDGHLPPLGYADSDSGVDTWDNLYLGFGSAIGATVPATGAALTKCTTFQSLAQ